MENYRETFGVSDRGDNVTELRRRREVDADRISIDLGDRLLAAVFLDRAFRVELGTSLETSDFPTPRQQVIWEALAAMPGSGAVDLALLYDEISARSESGASEVDLAEIADADATAAFAPEYAQRLRRRSLERQLGLACDRRDFDEIQRLRSALETTGTYGATPFDTAFVGQDIERLADRTVDTRVAAGIPPAGHLTLLIAPKGVGKTTLGLILAGARACGVPPWPGAAEWDPGRVLIISPDEPAQVVARRLRGLAALADWSFGKAIERVEVVAHDRDRPELDLRFTHEGIEALNAHLERAKRAGAPYSAVHFDAWVDGLPEGTSENDNAEVARIAGSLESIAVRHDVALLLNHHEGKPRPDATEGRDPRFAGRGASALNAKARCIFSLEMVQGSPHLRRIRTVTNLAPSPPPATFQVCEPTANGEEVIYFRPYDEIGAQDPTSILNTEPMTTTDVAWALSGRERETGKTPGGEAMHLATRLREAWRDDPRVVVSDDGPRGSKTMRLAE